MTVENDGRRSLLNILPRLSSKFFITSFSCDTTVVV